MTRDTDELGPTATADEIGQQVLDRYFEETWGPKRLEGHLVPRKIDSRRLHQSARVMHVSSFVHISNVTGVLLTSRATEAPIAHPKIPAELLQRRDQIIELAVKVFESERIAAAWLQRPLIVTFKGKRPMELLKNFEGCNQVDAFLRSLYPDRQY